MNMKFNFQKAVKISLLAFFSVSISGCGASLLTYRDTNPVIEDYTGNWLRRMLTGDSVSTFSTTASRRVVVVKDLDDKIDICSEPSPDVGEAFASSLADAIKLSAEKEGVTTSLSNQYARQVATQIAPLVYRTQGLQLYRNSMHDLCIDRMNNWISSAEYKEAKKESFKKAAELIQAEKDVMIEAQKAFFENVKNIAGKVAVEDAVKLLEATKPNPTPAPVK